MNNKIDTTLEEALAERNVALEAFDMDWAREQMPTLSTDFVREIAMHKERYECTAISRDARLFSAEWLRQMKYRRFDMSPLLPEGELPE